MVSFKFASVEKGKEILVKRDDYLKELSPHEYTLKMQSNKKIDEDVFLNFLKSCVLEWDEKEIFKIKKILSEVKSVMNLRINLSHSILLIKTNGKEEWNSAYTRENSIVLPIKRINSNSEDQLKKLIIHEIFHVISKNYPSLRNILYGIIGFEKINEVLLPNKLKSSKLTNPDAPKINYYTSVYFNDSMIPVVPITILKKGRKNIDSQKDILESVTTKMLVLEKENGQFIVPDNYTLLNLKEIKGLENKLGNIDYFQHPEETIANVFTKIIAGETKKIPKKLLKGIKKILI